MSRLLRGKLGSLFEIWVKDARKGPDGLEFRVIESRNARFTQNKVQSLEYLKENVGFWLNTGLGSASSGLRPVGMSSTHLPSRSTSANDSPAKDNADGKLGLLPDWEPSWAQQDSAGGAQVGVRGVEPTRNQDSSGALTDCKSGVPEKPSIYSRLRDRENVQTKRGVKRPWVATSPVSNVDSN